MGPPKKLLLDGIEKRHEQRILGQLNNLDADAIGMITPKPSFGNESAQFINPKTTRYENGFLVDTQSGIKMPTSQIQSIKEPNGAELFHNAYS